MPRFTVIETIVGKGGGAVGLSCRILDTKAEGQVEYDSVDFNRDTNRYERKCANGRWVDGLSFGNTNHAQCMSAALNLGWAELLKNDGSPDHIGAVYGK